ncbi:MAG TPA: YjgN family protein [Steroidobacteraceae bacterium]|jgi:uncharacterized membrane protein YjgN (DUF898 family)
MDDNVHAPDSPAAPAAPPVAPGPRIESFHFSATGAEYFRIWIVNLLLTIVTLGIYSAWAKVRRLRYFYGSTTLAGASFEYHGRPLAILKGRLIAAALVIPYFVVGVLFPPWDLLFVPAFLIALPFLVVKSRLFSMRMTSWRNIRFDFDGTYGGAAKVYFGFLLLTIVTFGLAAPYWTFARQRFLISHTRLGTTQFEFSGSAGEYYTAIILGGLAIVGGVVGATFLSILVPETAPIFGKFDLRSLFVLPLVGVAYMFGFAVMNAGIGNAAFGNTHIGPHRLRCDLRTARLFWLYLSGAVAAVFTLGLLIPWAKVRLVRYQLDSLQLNVSRDLEQFVATEQSQVAATGQEIGDLLDVDFGL